MFDYLDNTESSYTESIQMKEGEDPAVLDCWSLDDFDDIIPQQQR